MINTVYAAGEAAHGSPSSMLLFAYMGLFFLIAYFLIIRPKNKKEKEQQALINKIKSGDEVITYAGIMGKVEKVVDSYLIVNIADDVNIKLQKQHVANILPKGTLKAI